MQYQCDAMLLDNFQGGRIINDLYIAYGDDAYLIGDVESRPNRRWGSIIFHRPQTSEQVNAPSQILALKGIERKQSLSTSHC
jgi:hypothetical protein